VRTKGEFKCENRQQESRKREEVLKDNKGCPSPIFLGPWIVSFLPQVKKGTFTIVSCFAGIQEKGIRPQDQKVLLACRECQANNGWGIEASLLFFILGYWSKRRPRFLNTRLFVPFQSFLTDSSAIYSFSLCEHQEHSILQCLSWLLKCSFFSLPYRVTSLSDEVIQESGKALPKFWFKWSQIIHDSPTRVLEDCLNGPIFLYVFHINESFCGHDSCHTSLEELVCEHSRIISNWQREKKKIPVQDAITIILCLQVYY
jgi:hypothetical protein